MRNPKVNTECNFGVIFTEAPAQHGPSYNTHERPYYRNLAHCPNPFQDGCVTMAANHL